MAATLEPTLATVAQYFRFGIEAGLCDEDEARAWAFSIIDKYDEAPGEMFDITWRKPREQLIADLNAVRGDVDRDLMGGWLLAVLGQAEIRSMEGMTRVLKRAKQIAQSADLAEHIYLEFDAIEDDVYLADSHQCGTLEDCRGRLEESLHRYALPPFSFKQ